MRFKEYVFLEVSTGRLVISSIGYMDYMIENVIGMIFLGEL